MKNPTIDPEDLALALTDGKEIAFVDVREEGEFGQSHAILAVNLPLGRLEIMVREFLPRLSVRTVITDAGGGQAERAAELLQSMGYGDVATLKGGLAAWKVAGLELYSGVNVLSKTFGEWVEQRFATPSLSADEVKAKLDAGDDMVILDSRPRDEYRNMNIPKGINVPGGELVYRVKDMAPDPDTLVVVNCAGRTRSILGAQSLVNSGLANPVAALCNGTMGWQLAGHQLERGAGRHYGEISSTALNWSQEAAAGVADRFGVSSIDLAILGDWQVDRERTLYLLDVRSPEEYLEGHPSGARSAPGGQLVQATDDYVAVRNARIVLVDDNGVRARMTASWLKQLGWADCFVLEEGLAGSLETGPHVAEVSPAAGYDPDWISASDLQASLAEDGLTVIDVSPSPDFAKAHLPGAWWVARAELGSVLGRLPPTDTYVVTGADRNVPVLSARDLSGMSDARVLVLKGGNEAWREAGFPFEKGDTNLASEPVDVYYRPYEHGGAVEDAMQGYLDWELELPHKLARDSTLSFPHFEEES